MKRYASPLLAPVCPSTVSAHAQQKAVTIGVVYQPDMIELKKVSAMGFQVIA